MRYFRGAILGAVGIGTFMFTLLVIDQFNRESKAARDSIITMVTAQIDTERAKLRDVLAQHEKVNEELNRIKTELKCLPSREPFFENVRMNNPLRIKGRGWYGQKGSNAQGFAVFVTPYHGLRAGAIVLKNYEIEHGINNLEDLAKRLSRTDHKAYCEYLSTITGLKPKQSFSIIEYLPQLIKAIVMFENGYQPYPEELYVLFGIHSNL